MYSKSVQTLKNKKKIIEKCVGDPIVILIHFSLCKQEGNSNFQLDSHLSLLP